MVVFVELQRRGIAQLVLQDIRSVQFPDFGGFNISEGMTRWKPR